MSLKSAKFGILKYIFFIISISCIGDEIKKEDDKNINIKTENDIILEKLTQQLAEIDKKFAILNNSKEISLKERNYQQISKLKSDEIDKIISEITLLKKELENVSTILEKQNLQIEINNKKEEIAKKSDIQYVKKEKEKEEKNKQQKELLEKLKVESEILNLKIQIFYSEVKLGKLNKDVLMKKSKNEELKIIEEERRIKSDIKELETKLAYYEAIGDEDIKKNALKKYKIDLKKLDTEELRAELDYLKTSLEHKRAKQTIENIELERVINEKNILREKNDLLNEKIKYLENQETLYKKNIQSRDTILTNTVEYLKDPLTKDGILVLSDRQIHVGKIINFKAADKIDRLIDFYNNDIEHKGYPIFLIFDQGCYGGYCVCMQSIISKMEQSESPVYVIVPKFAYSAAAVITVCAKRSFIYECADMLMHQVQMAYYYIWANTSKWKEKAKQLEHYDRTLSKKFLKKLGLSYENYIKRMYENSCDGEGWFLLGEEAKKEKWVDHVIKGCRDTSIDSKYCNNNGNNNNGLSLTTEMKKEIIKDMQSGQLLYVEKNFVKDIYNEIHG